MPQGGPVNPGVADTLERMIRDAGPKGEPYRHSLHYLRCYILFAERKYDRALRSCARPTPTMSISSG